MIPTRIRNWNWLCSFPPQILIQTTKKHNWGVICSDCLFWVLFSSWQILRENECFFMVCNPKIKGYLFWLWLGYFVLLKSWEKMGPFSFGIASKVCGLFWSDVFFCCSFMCILYLVLRDNRKNIRDPSQVAIVRTPKLKFWICPSECTFVRWVMRSWS